MGMCRCFRVLFLLPFLLAGSAAAARAAEVMCDPSYQDCRATLLKLIAAEDERLDIAMWFMEDLELANAVVARHKAGVPVRVLVDPRRNTTTPMNATILGIFKDAGIPMRYKVGGGIMHWKFMLFAEQETLQFSAANYGDYYFRPAVPYLDYTDEGIYFTDDPALVNSFRRKFDDSWIDTAGFANYANVSGTPGRAYPLYAVDPDLSFVPEQDFAKRSVPLYDAETQKIDVIMYKVTEASHASAMIRAVNRGVPVRLITEPERYRNPENIWQAYYIDLMYTAGVQIRNRAHAGFLHQKSTLLYGQALTVFGSSNWTSESNKSQYEHNYFTDKTWFFTWFKQNFERKWGNLTGNAETKPFVPLPPDAPVLVSPANGATGISTSSAISLTWKAGPWGHRADVYFGTSPTPPLLAANISATGTKSFALPALSPGTTYYWRIVSRTMANQAASGPTYTFTTAGTGTEPPPDPEPSDAPEIVLHAANASAVAGGWQMQTDATAASGRRLWNPNKGAAKLTSALASPADYFELTFPARAGVTYRLWIRGRAESNAWANDSVFVQFSGSVSASGSAVYRIGTSSATEYNLESCSGCGLSGWGWEDNGWGSGVLGPLIRFAADGTQRIRIQRREDGLSIDQVVLSPAKYLSSPPGPAKNDATILPATSGSTGGGGGTSAPGEVVLHASQAGVRAGGWIVQSDATAAGGSSIRHPNAGAAKLSNALASPAHYFELTFNAEAGKPYRLWIRGKADSNSWANDSVFIQFAGSVNSGGTAVYRIGTTSAAEFNLESCSGCGLSGWGWEDNGWGTGVMGPLIYFSTTGVQRIRVQTREDGLSIDQIVLSPSKYLSSSPGATKNDTVILQK